MMSLKCFFGLIACLHSQGRWIPEPTVIDLLERCPKLHTISNDSYKDPFGSGVKILNELSGKGLKFDKSDDFRVSRRHALKACDTLAEDFNDKGKWRALKKSTH